MKPRHNKILLTIFVTFVIMLTICVRALVNVLFEYWFKIPQNVQVGFSNNFMFNELIDDAHSNSHKTLIRFPSNKNKPWVEVPIFRNFVNFLIKPNANILLQFQTYRFPCITIVLIIGFPRACQMPKPKNHFRVGVTYSKREKGKKSLVNGCLTPTYTYTT